MTTDSDDEVMYVRVQPQSATPAAPPEEDPTRRRDVRARAREADATTDGDRPGWAGRLAQACKWAVPRTMAATPPARPGILWERAGDVATAQDAPLPRLGAYLIGAVVVAVSAAVYGVAVVAAAPWQAGRLPALGDLWSAVDATARRPEDRTVRGVVRAAGVVCWAVTAACYAAVYAITFPALFFGLMVCACGALLSTLT